MSVRSDTVSSASASSARMRRRVASPAALRAAWSPSNRRWVEVDMRGTLPNWSGTSPAKPAGARSPAEHIKISLYVKMASRKRVGNSPTPTRVGRVHSNLERGPLGTPPALRLTLPAGQSEAFHERESVRHPPRRSGDRIAAGVRCRRLLHRPHPHAVDAPRAVPEERARVRRPLHHRGRGALCPGAHRDRDLQPPARALLDGQVAARPG